MIWNNRAKLQQEHKSDTRIRQVQQHLLPEKTMRNVEQLSTANTGTAPKGHKPEITSSFKHLPVSGFGDFLPYAEKRKHF